MAWNEPGGGGNKDPWGGGGNDGPPDLDELARKLRDRINQFFGGKGGGKGGGSGNKGTGMSLNFGLLAIVAVLAWVLLGIYIIEPAERGVVLRLGKFHTITGPGPHWYMRGIETVDKVDVDNLRTVSHRAKMLTRCGMPRNTCSRCATRITPCKRPRKARCEKSSVESRWMTFSVAAVAPSCSRPRS
jgi:membrane protease subunit HflK